MDVVRTFWRCRFPTLIDINEEAHSSLAKSMLENAGLLQKSVCEMCYKFLATVCVHGESGFPNTFI